MRRTLIILTEVAALAILAASTGPGARAIDTGPLSATPDPVAFGTELVGTTTPAQTVTLTNANGTVPLTITSVAAGGDYIMVNRYVFSLSQRFAKLRAEASPE